MALRRPVLSATLAATLFSLSLVMGLIQATPWRRLHHHFQASILGRSIPVMTGLILPTPLPAQKEGTWSFCKTSPSEEVDSSDETDAIQVSLEEITVDAGIQGETTFRVDLTFKNTGKLRLFSASSDCPQVPVLNLGTQKHMDRESIFGLEDRRLSGWIAANRIQMQEPFADPGAIFHFSFQSVAPAGDNLYREFFQPVVEGQKWIDEVIAVDIPVGTVSEEMIALAPFVQDESRGVGDFAGLSRNIVVDLSEQKMLLRVGDFTLWTLTISSGAHDTPTPVGTYKILSKQELRIGGKWPHYRMPYFQMWDSRGYGIHSLPYLENDGGVFWSEAFDHIGRAVSHGCIRTLPDDAAQIYAFTDVGTPIVVQR